MEAQGTQEAQRDAEDEDGVWPQGPALDWREHAGQEGDGGPDSHPRAGRPQLACHGVDGGRRQERRDATDQANRFGEADDVEEGSNEPED